MTDHAGGDQIVNNFGVIDKAQQDSLTVHAISNLDVTATGGTVLIYRMRGFDQNGAVNDFVYWGSTEVDADASDYEGSAGPVVDIVVHRVLGE